MTRLLFDTTFLVDGERAGGDLDDLFDDCDDVAVAAVTIAELRVGALLSTGKRKAARRAYVDDIVETIPILAYDLDVAEKHAELLLAVRAMGKPRGAHDLIIAATASASDRIVISADATGFVDLPGVTVRPRR